MAVENPTEETPETPVVTPEVNTPSLLDSINEALAPTLPPPVDPPETEESEEEEVEEGEEDEVEEGDEGVTVDAQGRRHGPDGKLLPKAADAQKLGADGKPVVEPPKLGADGKPLVEKAGGKKVDPVNDPIPEDVKGRTRDRMQSLITAVKEKDEMIGVQNQLFDSIKSTGASPEEFGAMLGYMRWVHSEKPEDLKQARDLLISELEGISLKLGEAAPGIDFLAKFPDLQEKVNAGQITVADANEMALHRQRTKVQTDQQTARATQEQTTQVATQARDSAIAELNALGSTLSSTDPEYGTKHEILKPVIDALGMLPPGKWKAAFTQAYKAITPAQVARYKATGEQPPVKDGKNTPGNQPLRANKSPSGGQKREPASMLDAVSAAIDSANG